MTASPSSAGPPRHRRLLLDRHGDATLVQHRASGGASPRFFLLLDDDTQRRVVHERDYRVTVPDTGPDGTLGPTGFVAEIPGAAFAFVI